MRFIVSVKIAVSFGRNTHTHICLAAPRHWIQLATCAVHQCISAHSIFQQFNLYALVTHVVGEQGKMMDVGAKAGYYTEKSPKMMLLEWCQQQKRSTPRYRSTAADGAVAAKCKVCVCIIGQLTSTFSGVADQLPCNFII